MNGDTIILLHIPRTSMKSIKVGICRTVPKGKICYKLRHLCKDIVYKFVFCGHFWYGIHKYIKNNNYKYVTIIRDPISRAISSYKYMVCRYNLNISLSEYICRSSGFGVDNLQTRMLCYSLKPTNLKYMVNDWCTLNHPKIKKSNIQEAIDNLNNFSIVGLYENRKFFIDRFKKLVTLSGYKNNFFSLETHVSTLNLDISNNELELLRKREVFDISLCNRVKDEIEC